MIDEAVRGLAERVTRLSPPARYGTAVAAAVVGLALRRAMDPVWGATLPFLMAFPAIALSGWVGGFWPGMVTTFISAVAVEYIWLEPRGAWPVPLGNAVALGAFVAPRSPH